MISRAGSPKARLAVLGVALLAMAAIGSLAAAAASAAPIWHAEGTPLTSETAKVAGGPIEIYRPWDKLKIKCTTVTTLANGKPVSRDEEIFPQLTVSGCEVASAPSTCQVKNGSFSLPGGGVGRVKVIKGLKYETVPLAGNIEILSQPGQSCATAGIQKLYGNGVAGLLGPEAVELTVNITPAAAEAAEVGAYLGERYVEVTGTLKLALDGEHKGQKWSAYEMPVEWRVNGKSFAGTETTNFKGGPFTFTKAFLYGDIQCSGAEAAGFSIFEKTKGKASPLTFTGCAVVGSPNCSVSTAGAENALQLFFVTTELKYVGTHLYDVFSFEYMPNIAIKSKPGTSGCWIPNANYPGWTGQLVAAPGPAAVTDSLTFSPAASEAVGTKLTAGGNSVGVSGSATQALTGANKGAVWGANY